MPGRLLLLIALAGVRRLTAVGCKFLWSDEGAWLQLPKGSAFKGEWVQLEIHGGLPYLVEVPSYVCAPRCPLQRLGRVEGLRRRHLRTW